MSEHEKNIKLLMANAKKSGYRVRPAPPPMHHMTAKKIERLEKKVKAQSEVLANRKVEVDELRVELANTKKALNSAPSSDDTASMSSARSSNESYRVADLARMFECSQEYIINIIEYTLAKATHLDYYKLTDLFAPKVDYNSIYSESPKDRLDHLKGNIAEVDYRIKTRKDEVEGSLLIPMGEVVEVVGGAFKVVAMSLDALPDNLEREGIVKPEYTDDVIVIIDGLRADMYLHLQEFRDSKES